MSDEIVIKTEYWTATEIGARVRKSKRAASRMLNRGELPAVKIGGSWVMSEAAYQAKLLMAAQK